MTPTAKGILLGAIVGITVSMVLFAVTVYQ